MIAATARAYGVQAIATRNAKEFAGCGVTLINPDRALPVSRRVWSETPIMQPKDWRTVFVLARFVRRCPCPLRFFDVEGAERRAEPAETTFRQI